MLVIRRKELYLASLDPDLEKEILVPRRPNDIFASHGVGDTRTERICFYQTKDQAISALGPGLEGKVVYIYSPYNIRPISQYVPPLQDAPFRDKTGEVWDLTTARVKLVGRVQIARAAKKEVLTYYNPRPTSLEYIKWGWKDLDVLTKKEKVVFLSPLDKPSLEVPGGVQTYRKIEEGVNDWAPGQVLYVYKPESGKLSLPPTLILQERTKFVRGGKILVQPGHGYKTL